MTRQIAILAPPKATLLDIAGPREAAQLTNMSPRNFARLFTRHVGAAPAKFVEHLRIDAARRRPEEASDNVDAIAAHVGFGNSQSMRRSNYRSQIRTITLQ